MTDYSELVKALRCENTGDDECGSSDCPYWSGLGCMDGQLMEDAAAAIDELQADNAELESCVRTLTEQRDYWKDKAANMEPKRGKWILCGEVGWPNWKCSVCHSEGRGDYRRCPWCGAVMDESNASNALDNAQDGPIITPCRGCSDYDGYGGCKSKGGCARAKMEDA